MGYSNNSDTNDLPVHLLVKSPKEAKKVIKQQDIIQSEPVVYKRINKFRPTSYMYASGSK